jgi:hypothetical protein
MSAETDALDAAAAAATAQTVAADNLTTAVGLLETAYSATKATVDNDLNLVDNTADADKPVSAAGQTALDLKLTTSSLSTVNGVALNLGGDLVIARSATSLVSKAYDDREDLRDVPSVASILDDSAVIEGLGLFMFVTTQDEPDDDETCFTPTTGQWLLAVPAYDLLAAIALVEESYRDELDEDEETRFATYFNNL